MIAALMAKHAVHAGFEAMNSRDPKAAHKDWAEDATLVYPGDIEGVSGTHIGKEAIDAWYRHLFEQFPSLHLTVKHVAVSNMFDWIGNNVIDILWESDMTNGDGFRIKNSGVSVMTIRKRKVTHYQMYIFDTGENLRRSWGAPTLRN